VPGPIIGISIEESNVIDGGLLALGKAIQSTRNLLAFGRNVHRYHVSFEVVFGPQGRTAMELKFTSLSCL
jgi:hypothetical protein